MIPASKGRVESPTAAESNISVMATPTIKRDNVTKNRYCDISGMATPTITASKTFQLSEKYKLGPKAVILRQISVTKKPMKNQLRSEEACGM